MSSIFWARNEVRRLFLLAPLLALSILFALGIGRYPLQPGEILSYAAYGLGLLDLPAPRADLLHNLIVEIRLPRVLAAALIGAALSSSGAAYQAVFRNPLVSPGILGVLGGASFGAALGILVSGNWFVVQSAAFVMGVAAVSVGVLIANLYGAPSIIVLVLGGMISGAFFNALLSLVKYAADPADRLPTIVYWLMGSLGGLELSQVAFAAAPILVGVALLSLLGRALDAMTMGDDEAASLGVPVFAVRYGVIGLATLISSLSVALAGMIGWIGLVVPHIARLMIGPLNRRLIPASALIGATFLVLADCLSRNIAAAELPIGVITELLGVPAFVVVLRYARRGWV